MNVVVSEVLELATRDRHLAKCIGKIVSDAIENDAAFKSAIMSAMSDLDAHICKVWDDRGAVGYEPDEQQWQDIPF